MNSISSPVITETSTFAIDVEEGLSKYPKQLSSKYFYDAAGDQLFQDIMAMPEYYLTNCEYDIFTQQKAAILEAFGEAPFELIELGAGDGTKTKILLDYFLQQEADFTYRPIDISGNVLTQLTAACAEQFPKLKVDPVKGDYTEALAQIKQEDNHRRKVVLFLGGNIGNFPLPNAKVFIKELAICLSAGDLLLTGFDLKKDPKIVQLAYDDPAGITAAFNLNLLTRINKELGGAFDVDKFMHWETYNPLSGEARSYIVSKEEQLVQIEQLQLSVHFEAWEAIAVEVSAKYSERDIIELAEETGFTVNQNFVDPKAYFMDSLWELKV
ncbi:L-histidine N(alpha)-methyltransferase [Lewinella sp. LCG006]|uniref:L-histidine N(alpha)-methyltransferase n=1 Tax=Lewinella sp. LCG006 TaxID=3231911 RepID=UPI00345F2581